MTKVVRQPKSVNVPIAERRTGGASASLMPMLHALLALYLMVTAAAATSDCITEGGPSMTLNGAGDTECDSDNMGSCLESIGAHSHEGKSRPDAFFLGASKCGTTSMTNWMAHHPAMRWYSIHRLRFPWRFDGGEAKYGSSNDVIFREDMIVGPNDTYGLTASANNASTRLINYAPHFLMITSKPYRILKEFGSAATDGSMKYIVSIREPASRTISSWEFKYSWKTEDENFDINTANKGAGFRRLMDAVGEGIEGTNRLLECMGDEYQLSTADREEQCVLDFERCPPDSYLGPNGNFFLAHVGKGMYALQLKRWFKILGQENFKVIFFEEMVADSLATMQSIFDFLGVDLVDRDGKEYPESLEYWERVVSVIHNETSEKKKAMLGQEVSLEIIQTLRDFFAPHNTELEHLLGRPLPDSWSTSSE